MNIEKNIKLAADTLKNADALLITAGAGIGVDSGLPDFRGTSGFWKEYPPIAKLGVSFSEMANPRWFFEKPELAWAFYGHRLNLYRETIPHSGYFQLLEIGEEKPGGYFVFTSNVDGQFQKAGYNDEYIEECHGSIHHFQCIEPCCNNIWDANEEEIIVDMDAFQAQEPFPKCINCGSIARPNILMFGDWHWMHERSSEQSNNLENWLINNYQSAMNIVIIELGAGTSVATVRYKSEEIANKFDATLIRINPRDFHVPSGHISIPLGAKEGIEKILNFCK